MHVLLARDTRIKFGTEFLYQNLRTINLRPSRRWEDKIRIDLWNIVSRSHVMTNVSICRSHKIPLLSKWLDLSDCPVETTVAETLTAVNETMVPEIQLRSTSHLT